MVGSRDLQTGSMLPVQFKGRSNSLFPLPPPKQREKLRLGFHGNLVCPETEPLEGTKSHQIFTVCWTFWCSNSSSLLSLPSHSLPTHLSVRFICLLLNFIFSSPISLPPSFHHPSLSPLHYQSFLLSSSLGKQLGGHGMSQKQEELG